MTTVLHRVPVDRISDTARTIRVGRLLLTLVAAVFFLVGWLAGRAALGVVWCGVAVKLGWLEARKAQARDAAG